MSWWRIRRVSTRRPVTDRLRRRRSSHECGLIRGGIPIRFAGMAQSRTRSAPGMVGVVLAGAAALIVGCHRADSRQSQQPVEGLVVQADEVESERLASHVDCLRGRHDGGDGTCRSTGLCSPGFHDDGTGACAAVGCAPGYVLSRGRCMLEWRSVSAGSGHACGVKADGAVACWGSSRHGQARPPPGTFASVSAGYEHTCGLRTDGTVACWGRDVYGETRPPPGTFDSVSAGTCQTCGLRTDGAVVCWGPSWNEATRPPNVTFDSLSTHGDTTCGVTPGGIVYCWGAYRMGP